MTSVSLLISTCDKFSDLWDAHVALLKKNWQGITWPVYMVTDKPTERKFDGVEIIVAGEDKDFPMRIKYAVDRIESDYFLLTLDDYFLINEVREDQLNHLAKLAKKKHVSYLKLYDRRRTNPKKYGPLDKLEPIDLCKKYAVTLYPAIWEKGFLFHSVSTDMTPWKYEPSLTPYALSVNAKCAFSNAGTFQILDVVRKGKVLHKANRYFKKNNIDIGDRKIISYFTELKLFVLDFLSWHMPRKLFKLLKGMAKRLGFKFYSED